MTHWTKTDRTMLRAANQIGAKPFVLFLYYRTWENARDGIFPPLRLIARDLEMEPSAICNLRKRLIDAGWIKMENGLIFITKTFTGNEQSSLDVNDSDANHSQNMNGHSQKMNTAFTKNESPYIETSQKSSSKKISKKESAGPRRIPDPFPLTDEMEKWLTNELPGLRDRIGAHEAFIEYYTNCTTKKAIRSNWQMTWKKGMRLALKWQDRDEKYGNGRASTNNGGQSASAGVGSDTRSIRERLRAKRPA